MNIYRRSFLKLLGQGVIVSSSLFNFPFAGFAKSAFDYALEGQNLIQKNRFSDAVVALQESVRIDPSSDWAFGLLGRAYYGLGNKAEAISAFRKAVRLNPNDTFSRMMIDIISQRPIPRLKKKQRPPSALEMQAKQEESSMLKTLRIEKSLGYQVKRVVIDAGHGGFDPGAVGKNGLREKDVTLDLALKLHETLMRQSKIKSFLTRTGDYYVPLSARTVTANQYQADLFISIHINASKKRESHGSETYFCSEKASSAEAEKVAALENSVLKFDEPFKKKPEHIDIEEILFKFEQKLYWSESGKFANAFQQRFKQNLPLKSRGVHSANFYVLRRTKMPSILLEAGFISNPNEEALLRNPDFRSQIVDAIARGLT
ncbi:MAG: N-acetylmuramoyl-L-alanine amidase [Desulfobacterales bacterium]|nr:MAG: N-acetylmuramoyl-L-alanine amidase [Desulfobacterales bacterium]